MNESVDGEYKNSLTAYKKPVRDIDLGYKKCKNLVICYIRRIIGINL